MDLKSYKEGGKKYLEENGWKISKCEKTLSLQFQGFYETQAEETKIYTKLCR